MFYGSRACLWPCLMSVTMLVTPSAAWADGSTGTTLVIASTATPAPEPLIAHEPVPVSPITIAKPIGQISLARVGDELGAARYRSSATAGALDSIRFVSSPTPRPGAVTGVYTGAEKFPTGLPLDSALLTSRFGYRLHPVTGKYQPHSGIDLAAPAGTPIVSTSDGVVISAGWMGGYGLTVRVDHGGGIETRYAHMSRIAVSELQEVTRGQVIGFVGSTGRSTGSHLHYEVREANRAVNPLR